MTKEKMYDPFEGFKQFSEVWEKQLNGLLYRMSDNNEFVRLLKVGTESHSRYVELLRKNQEFLAGFMNVPTKNDIANVAKLSIKAEEKIDSLEVQMWKLQDSFGSLTKENLEMFQEIVKIVKQMKTESLKTRENAAEIKKIKEDLQEIRKGLVDIKIIQVNLDDLQKDMASIKDTQIELKGMNNPTDTAIIQSDLQNVKRGLNQLSDIKSDIATLRGLLEPEISKDKGKEGETELVTS
jgi:hypothetical protein